MALDLQHVRMRPAGLAIRSCVMLATHTHTLEKKSLRNRVGIDEEVRFQQPKDSIATDRQANKASESNHRPQRLARNGGCVTSPYMPLAGR